MVILGISHVGNGRLGGLLARRVPAWCLGTSRSSFCGESGGKGACFVHAGTKALFRESFNETDKFSFLGVRWGRSIN